MFVLFQTNASQYTLEDLGVNLVKPYKINDRMVNQTLELQHGKSIKAFLMDKVSNSKIDSVRLLLVSFLAKR